MPSGLDALGLFSGLPVPVSGDGFGSSPVIGLAFGSGRCLLFAGAGGCLGLPSAGRSWSGFPFSSAPDSLGVDRSLPREESGFCLGSPAFCSGLFVPSWGAGLRSAEGSDSFIGLESPDCFSGDDFSCPGFPLGCWSRGSVFCGFPVPSSGLSLGLFDFFGSGFCCDGGCSSTLPAFFDSLEFACFGSEPFWPSFGSAGFISDGCGLPLFGVDGDSCCLVSSLFCPRPPPGCRASCFKASLTLSAFSCRSSFGLVSFEPLFGSCWPGVLSFGCFVPSCFGGLSPIGFGIGSFDFVPSVFGGIGSVVPLPSGGFVPSCLVWSGFGFSCWVCSSPLGCSGRGCWGSRFSLLNCSSCLSWCCFSSSFRAC